MRMLRKCTCWDILLKQDVRGSCRNAIRLNTMLLWIHLMQNFWFIFREDAMHRFPVVGQTLRLSRISIQHLHFTSWDIDVCAKPLDAADSYWKEWVAGNLFVLMQHLVDKYMVKRVVTIQILHRVQPRRPVMYPATWLGSARDATILTARKWHQFRMKNTYFSGHIIYVWFWTWKNLSVALGDDVTHPKYEFGYPKQYKNIRTVVVSMKKDLL